MDKQIRDKLIALFKKYQIIKLVYFFGSKANNSDGVLSDYDLAFYLDEKFKDSLAGRKRI